MPEPVSAIVRSALLEETVTVPVLEPVAVGSNVTRTLHVSFACNSVPFEQSPLAAVALAKSPVTATPEIVTSSPPLFVTVDSLIAVAPSSTSLDPYASVPGALVRSVGRPVPETGTSTSAAFDVSFTVADFGPSEVGEKRARRSHV